MLPFSALGFLILVVVGSHSAVNCSNFNRVEQLLQIESSEDNYVAEYQDGSEIDSSVTIAQDKSTLSWTATLACSFNTGQQFELSWHVNGQRIDETTHSPSENVVNGYVAASSTATTTLTITDFGYELAFEYTCLLVNATGFANATLLALARPDLDVTTIIANEHETISVNCSSFPGAVIDWRLPGFSLAHDASFEEDSSETTGTTWNVMTMTTSSFDTSRQYYCCVRGPASPKHSLCSRLIVEVAAPPLLIPTAACTKTGKCLLVCSAFGYPRVNETDMQWNAVNLTGLNATLTSKYSTLGSYVTRARAVTENYNDFNYYECEASNSEGLSSFDTSYLEMDNQAVGPPFLTRSLVFVGNDSSNESFSLHYFCEFQSHPELLINGWVQLPMSGSSTGIGFLKNSSDYNIKTWKPTTGSTVTMLSINSYQSDRDNAIFNCFGVNDVGFNFSAPMTPNSKISNFTVTIDNQYPNAGDSVKMTCSGIGFPPPKIEWKVFGEYSLDMSETTTTDMVTGFTTSSMSVLVDWTDDHIYFECSVYSEFNTRTVLVGSKTIIVNHSPNVTSSSSCSPNDFSSGGECPLSVSVQLGNNFTEINSGWLYYTNGDSSISRYANITEGVTIYPDSPFRTVYKLTLSSYGAGYYEFWSAYTNNINKVNLTQTFKIDPNQKGSYLNGECTQSSQCLTLNSICLNNICQCVNPYYIQSDNDDNSTLCLEAAVPGGNCQQTKQCSSTPNYICSLDNICICDGKNTSINGEYHCIKAAKHGQQCDWNEECWLTDVNSECENNVCDCGDSYNFNSNDQDCEAQGSLSVAAIIIICVAVFLISALIFAVVGGCLRKRNLRKSNDWPGVTHYSDDEPSVAYDRFQNQPDELDDGAIRIVESVQNPGYSVS